MNKIQTAHALLVKSVLLTIDARTAYARCKNYDEFCASPEYTALHQKVDELLSFCMDNMESPGRQHDDGANEKARYLRTLVKFQGGTYDDVLDSGKTETIHEYAWPIAALKILLAHSKAPLVPTSLKQFDRFHKAYGWLIIAAYDDKFISS